MDHLVLGVPDLAEGVAMVERLTGVRARFGGQHPGRGTHNALLALGGRQYLEIIAMDPAQTNAPGLLFPGLEKLTQPRLIAWAVAVASVADVVKRAQAAGIETIGPLPGSRAQPDGSLLAWKTLRIGGAAPEGVPFFIEWHADTTHPSQVSPAGCVLTSFTIEHTDPVRIGQALKSLGVEANILSAPRVRLKAQVRSPKGEVELG